MKSATALACVFTVLLAVCVGLVSYSASLVQAHPEEYLKVSDKPEPVSMAIEAAEEVEEQEEEWYEDSVSYSYYGGGYYNYHDSDYDDLSARDYIAQRESGQSYDARNGQYIGKYQLQKDMLAGDYSPENQEYMAEQYMLERYGSWEAARDFWDSHGWW